MGDISGLVSFAGNSIYAVQAAVALWGAFCIIIAWRRLSQIRFKSELVQNEFLEQLDESLVVGDLESAVELCDGDRRIVPQLVLLGIENRDLGYVKIKQLLADRFQRDVLAELEYRITWVATMAKTAPMLGLLGTVLGMMAAFGKLAGQQKVDATHLAGDISLALLTTFVGLTIAIPLSMVLASLQIRQRHMEDLAGEGIARFLEGFKPLVEQQPEGVH